jgi:hypothetical protein
MRARILRLEQESFTLVEDWALAGQILFKYNEDKSKTICPEHNTMID